MVLGGREEGEGHLGGSRSPGTCAETRMHAAESGEEACAMAGGDGRGLNGAEQAEDTRRGPRHGVRTMCWTCTQRAAGPLEVSAAVEKALWECGPRWEGVGRRQGGPRRPHQQPRLPPPHHSLQAGSSPLGHRTRATSVPASKHLLVCSLHQDPACCSHLPVPKHLLSKTPLPRSPCLPKAPNFGRDGILKLK